MASLEPLLKPKSCAQVDSFNKAASKGSGKLSRLFSARKSPRTSPSPANSISTPLSPATGLSVDDMLIYQNVRFPRLQPASELIGLPR